MSLSIGIVGLPNVGKSTLFNALLKKQQAFVANFPFATIEPNIGVVPVPDKRLLKLSKIYNSPIVPATVEFVDIAGLIAGASKGEGLGNKFLSHIREVNAILHVVRVFPDSDIIKEGSLDPKSDFEVIKTELELADLETVEHHEKKKLSKAKSAFGGNAEDNLQLLSQKPFLVCLNVSESDLKNSNELEERYASEFGINKDQVVAICAKTEEQLAGFSEVESKEYLHELGIEKTAIDRLIQKAYKTLGLISFLTAGEKEVRAWTIKNGTTAVSAAGVIHNDFIKKFIKADVVKFEDFVGLGSPEHSEGGWKECREKGKVRSEGRDYIMQDGDVVEFKIGA